ncbi:uncharacterized protein [Eucyclogobius newberryi]|uniref:uncharacterized protein n=1 Tax=Eucyclogobius newberryi TaxID=166745 RepID=UPI003B5A547B
MSGPHFLLRLCFTGCFCICCLAWYVKIPHHIVALRGSCLVIPCSFDYHQYPPVKPDRVVWYQFVSRGYPLVYDDWYPDSVISIFKGKTYVSTYGRHCTLQIYPVTWSHHKQKLYPWVDPENVGKGTYKFYDTTVTIEVTDKPQKPNLRVTGDKTVGQFVTVQCIVDHTCRLNPPALSLNIPLKEHSVHHSSLTDGSSRMTLTTVMFVERDQQTVECVVKHFGGVTETTRQTLNAKCSIATLSITPTTEEFLEGVSTKVTCTASYTCAQNIPTLTWNYGNMEASTHTSSSGKARWKTISTVKFISASEDHGKYLTCYANFAGAQIQEASIQLRIKRNMMSRGWSFSAPNSVTGMAGSCVVIPCTFTYTQSRPADPKVLWYLYHSNKYLPVYGPKQEVDRKYNSRTSLIGSVNDGNCSMKIDRLETSHSQDRVYPWVDKNPITSYHTVGHSFYDKTTQIIVSDHAKEPELSIIGILRVGVQSRVSCSVQHSCISAPPNLALSGVSGEDDTRQTMLSEGVWEQRVERVWTVSEDDQRVECTVSYPGGQKATSEIGLNIECPYEDITMIEKPMNLTEGIAKYVACSVTYKCKKNTPNIVWNFADMQSETDTKQISKDTYQTVSNMTFIGSLNDEHKVLTCTAHFKNGETADSVALQITRYEKPESLIEDDILPAIVPFRVNALSRSCVVIPCSYQTPQDLLLTRGIWTKQSGDVVYHNGRSQIVDHFKDRTRILGDLHKGDCSLEIDDIKPFDNGPFCFKAEKGSTTYRFNNSCAFVLMSASPDKPVMTKILPEAAAGSVVTVSCSVTHTCPTRPPEFKWSIATLTNEVTHKSLTAVVWETTSNISFTVPAEDGPKSVTCIANFWRNKQESNTSHFNVKGSLIHLMRRSVPIVAPPVFIAIIVAVVVGVIICKKRRKIDESLRPPPRPEKRRSLFDRLNRNKEAGERPPRPEKRYNKQPI